MMHRDLIRILSDLTSIFFEPMWGNNGDRLIKEGSLAIFHDLKIRLVNFPDRAEAIVINGGGAMTPDWGGLDVLDSYIKKYNRPLIILPSSFFLGGQNELSSLSNPLKKYKNQVYIFCRELASYERLRAISCDNIRILLDHDMAFYLTEFYLKSKFFIRNNSVCGALIVERRDAERSTEITTQKSWNIPMKNCVPRWIKRPIKRMLVSKLSTQTEFVKSCISIMDTNYPNVDLHQIKYLDISDNSICSFREFLSLVNSVEIVFTTRLHVAILCHLFNKICYLKGTGGLYQKNEQVFFHSLSDSPYVRLML